MPDVTISEEDFPNELEFTAIVASWMNLIIEKDNPFLLQVFFDTMIDHFALILSPNTGQELLFSFWDAQTIKGVLDIVGHIIP